MGNFQTKCDSEYYIVNDSTIFGLIDLKNLNEFLKTQQKTKLDISFPSNFNRELFRVILDNDFQILVYETINLTEFKLNHPFTIKSIAKIDTTGTGVNLQQMISENSAGPRILKKNLSDIQILNFMREIQLNKSQFIITGEDFMLYNKYKSSVLEISTGAKSSLEIFGDNKFYENYFISMIYEKCVRTKGFTCLSNYTIHEIMIKYDLTKDEIIEIIKSLEIKSNFDYAVCKVFSSKHLNIEVEMPNVENISSDNFRNSNLFKCLYESINALDLKPVKKTKLIDETLKKYLNY